MKIVLTENAKMPVRAHPYDAGLDLFAPKDVTIPGCKCSTGFNHGYGKVYVGSRTVDTLVRVEIPKGYVGFVKSKSGLMVKDDITTDGTVDSGYTGSIRVKLFNHGNLPVSIERGMKIAQLVIVPCVLLPLELVDSLEETDRGDSGFGSTGR